MALQDEYIKTSMGHLGAEIVANTDAKTGKWGVIYFVTSGAFSALTGQNLSGTWTGVTFPAGAVIYGNFTAFTLSSGTVIAYRSPSIP